MGSINITLSTETVEKIISMAFGRLHDLKVKKEIAAGAEKENPTRRNKTLINTIEEAEQDAREIHALFLELLEEANS